MEVLGIIISLVLLIFLVYRGVSILIVSPLMAMLVALFSQNVNTLDAWTGILMTGTATFIRDYYPVFLVGAIFGMLMKMSNAALVISLWLSNRFGNKYAVFAVTASSFLLVYGGVSVYVVVFVILPIAENIFKNSGIPYYLIPAVILSGAMPAYVAPGAAQFVNTIPIQLLGTDIYSGMTMGVLGVAGWLVLGVFYILHLIKPYTAEQVSESQFDNKKNMPSTKLAFVPILLVIVGNYLLTQLSYLTVVVDYFKPYGGVNGIWPMTISISMTIVMILILFSSYIVDKLVTLSRGASDSLPPVFNTGVQVGYGAVIKNLSVFATIKSILLVINIPSSLLIILSAGIVAGIVGSAAGGTGILMQAFGHELIVLAENSQISMANLHRLLMFGANILGTLPHSGLIITLLSVCHLTHRKSYKTIFIVSCLFPFIITLLLILLLHLGLF